MYNRSIGSSAAITSSATAGSATLEHVDDTAQRHPYPYRFVLDEFFEIAQLAVKLLASLTHQDYPNRPVT